MRVHRVAEALLAHGARATDPFGLLVLESTYGEEEVRVGPTTEANSTPVLIEPRNNEIQRILLWDLAYRH